MPMPHGPAVSDLFLLSPLSPTSFPGCPPLLTASWAFRVVCVCVCVCMCGCVFVYAGAHASTCLGMPKVMSPHWTGWGAIPKDLRGSHPQREPHGRVGAGLGLESSPAPLTLHPSFVLGQCLPLWTPGSQVSQRVGHGNAFTWPLPRGWWRTGAPGTQASPLRGSGVHGGLAHSTCIMTQPCGGRAREPWLHT